MTDKENLEHDDESNPYRTITLQQVAEWKKKGPLGVLHNLVVFLHGSDIRMHQFKALSRNHIPARDNSTRWNSWERAIRVALTPPVRKALNDYFDEYVIAVAHLDRYRCLGRRRLID